MTVHLLDANVLIALTVTEHEHHRRASRWVSSAGGFAVSPIVQGALVRFLVRIGHGSSAAQQLLAALARQPSYEFWPDDLSYADADLAAVVGHRQVTDAYLVALAHAHGGILATLDGGLAAWAGRRALLVPG